MGINVKSGAVESEVRLLANDLGVGLTEAILMAVQAKRQLLAEAKKNDLEARMAKIRELQEVVKAHVGPETTSDHSWIYDENGMPVW
jgi:hypothetical protein